MQTTPELPVRPDPSTPTTHVPGGLVTATGLTVLRRNGAVALDDVTLSLEPGRLTAVIGPSGAGKTTLIRALAGLEPVHRGTVSIQSSDSAPAGSAFGFVPQDDILHTDLPLRRTLRYAARLRMAGSAAEIDSAVDAAMERLGLTPYGDQPVRSLSGGQRKRASIAMEILTRPRVSFLDEPTSGLDPATAADLVRHLHGLCADGGTVVFTTHSVQDIELSDRVVVLGQRGRVLAVGSPPEVLRRLGATTFPELFARIAAEVVPPAQVLPRRATRESAVRPSWSSSAAAPRRRPLRQLAVLTRRSAELLARSRLTLAILLGSPAAVISMFGIMFRPDSFAPGVGDPTSAVQVAYWLSFAGFFFGLTFGLLQVCTEVAIVSRERHAGVSMAAYLASKIGLLMPVLLLVDAVMLVVLRALDRLPTMAPRTVMELYVTMSLNALAALCLGLLASAAVASTAQAALALPMLCFPAVLFAGAMVPLPLMPDAGRAIGAAMPDRWGFEAIARSLDVAALTGAESPYRSLGGWSMASYWALLAAFTVALGAAAYVVIRRRV